MSKFIDLTGEKYNRLTVIRRVANKGTQVMWECLCDCGNITYVSSNALRQNRIKSCGCLKREHEAQLYEDLKGQTFGRLTVLNKAPNHKNRVAWVCKCNCGNTITVVAKTLKNGSTKSCGCIKSELLQKRNKKEYIYDLMSYDYGVGYTSKGEQFLFDKEDYIIVSQYGWSINKGHLEVKRRDSQGKMRRIALHRLIVNCPDGLEVDHINGNPLDNRKENLRICTHAENTKNHQRLYKNNTSGYTGIYFKEATNKWIAVISLNHKTKHIGTYNTKEEAIKAREAAELKYYGEYSHLNNKE